MHLQLIYILRKYNIRYVQLHWEKELTGKRGN